MSDQTRSPDGIEADDLVSHGDGANVIAEYAARDIIAATKKSDRVIQVKRYDFRRPDKFSREELRSLSIVHETLARANTATLSALLHADCRLRIRATDQLNFGEFMAMIAPTDVVGLMSLSPLSGSFVFAMSADLASATIELMGGSPTASSGSAGRPITELERGALSSVFTRLAVDLTEAWRPVMDVEGRFQGLERDPRNVRLLSLQEMVVLVAFECSLGEVRGELLFAIPFLLIEPIIPKLKAKRFYANGAHAGRSQGALRRMSHIPLSSSLYYEAGELSLFDLATLKKGAMIPLTGRPTGPLVFEAGGKPLLRMTDAGTGKRGAYTVTENLIGDAYPNDDAESGAAVASKDAPQDSPGVLSGLASVMEAAFSRLERKLDELSARQDELADRSFFGSEEKPFGESGRPLAFAIDLDRGRLADFLSSEHLQTAALILSCLDPAPAGDLLSRLSETAQPEIARRIARMGTASPLMLAEIEATLKRRSDLVRGARVGSIGGPTHLAEMQKSASSPAAIAAVAEALASDEHRE